MAGVSGVDPNVVHGRSRSLVYFRGDLGGDPNGIGGGGCGDWWISTHWWWNLCLASSSSTAIPCHAQRFKIWPPESPPEHWRKRYPTVVGSIVGGRVQHASRVGHLARDAPQPCRQHPWPSDPYDPESQKGHECGCRCHIAEEDPGALV